MVTLEFVDPAALLHHIGIAVEIWPVPSPEKKKPSPIRDFWVGLALISLPSIGLYFYLLHQDPRLNSLPLIGFIWLFMLPGMGGSIDQCVKASPRFRFWFPLVVTVLGLSLLVWLGWVFGPGSRP